MNGIEIALKALGIDPQKLIQDLLDQALPQVQPLLDKVSAELADYKANQEARFDELLQAVKSINPDYVPAGFKEGELEVDASKVEPEVITNEGLSKGGPVDPATLDPVKLAEAGMEQAAMVAEPPLDTPAQLSEMVAEDTAAAAGIDVANVAGKSVVEELATEAVQEEQPDPYAGLGPMERAQAIRQAELDVNA
jgi:hypothetical protein